MSYLTYKGCSVCGKTVIFDADIEPFCQIKVLCEDCQKKGYKLALVQEHKMNPTPMVSEN